MSLKNFMVLVLSVSLVIGVVLTGGCVRDETVNQETPAQIIEDVTAQEAFTLIQNNQDDPGFVIIDVRTPEEFAEGHIEKAVNIDFRSETFRDEVDNLDKNKTYLIYCRSGRRSADALNIMRELNFMKIYHMAGGMIEWTAEELPTVK